MEYPLEKAVVSICYSHIDDDLITDSIKMCLMALSITVAESTYIILALLSTFPGISKHIDQDSPYLQSMGAYVTMSIYVAETITHPLQDYERFLNCIAMYRIPRLNAFFERFEPIATKICGF